MADLLPALSSDEENGKFDDDDDDYEDEGMDVVFGGLLVSRCLWDNCMRSVLQSVVSNFFSCLFVYSG